MGGLFHSIHENKFNLRNANAPVLCNNINWEQVQARVNREDNKMINSDYHIIITNPFKSYLTYVPSKSCNSCGGNTKKLCS